MDQYKKIGRFTDILEYFSTREWIFSNNNVQSLWNSLNNDDKTLFPFDIKKMHWEEYLDTYHKGIMTFLLKEGQDKLPEARKRLHGYALSNNLYIPIRLYLVWLQHNCTIYRKLYLCENKFTLSKLLFFPLSISKLESKLCHIYFVT